MAFARLRLTGLDLIGNRGLTDLRPLADMPLDFLQISDTSVQDLTPLQKTAKLVHFYCCNCRVYDLSPLKGQPLKHLRCDGTPVKDSDAATGDAAGLADVLWNARQGSRRRCTRSRH